MPNGEHADNEQGEGRDEIEDSGATETTAQRKDPQIKKPESKKRSGQTEEGPQMSPTPIPSAEVISPWMQAWMPIILNCILLFLVLAQAVSRHLFPPVEGYAEASWRNAKIYRRRYQSW